VSVASRQGIDDLLAEARARIVRHTPHEASVADALLVDLRSSDERMRDGVIPGSIHVPRSVLEWRCEAGLPVAVASEPGDALPGMGGPQ